MNEANSVDRRVVPGSRWLHTNGSTYKVLHVANEYADEARRNEYPLTVVYQGSDGRVWAKSMEGFLRSRTPIVRTKPGLFDDLPADSYF